ncbi:LURP-one-related/scramblase family protein [Peptoniphilus harei]|uniref:LURP-one-related family protein n=1 Tax=Peptoniphilus harei TaxID=54005 RepID=A0A943SMZ1_9FIRM|nr:LURP-one-related family protein [Peptoniphilus harei]MBS6535048.1 LURP-one-related family protein [Peptoniphilus harei]
MKNYYFKENLFKITDHYPILDDDRREVYYVDQDFTFIGYDVKISDINGNEILKIEKEVFSLLQKFNVNFSDGKFMRVESKISFLVRRIGIDYNGESLRLEGQFPDLNFEIYKGDKVIGEIEKTFFALADTYRLTVYDEKYTEALLALTLCVNNIKDTASKRNSN